jgi:hypothetical protein
MGRTEAHEIVTHPHPDPRPPTPGRRGSLDLAAQPAAAAPPASATQPDLGPNVVVFDPSMPVSQIQATVDAVNAEQIDPEMGTGRHVLLFKPGVYGTDAEPLQLKVGCCTAVAGLCTSPTDVASTGRSRSTTAASTTAGRAAAWLS